MPADTRAAAADNYSGTDVTAGNVVDPAWKNSDIDKLETSINQARAMLADLEPNYASGTAPGTLEGKDWYDSDDDVWKGYRGSTWVQKSFRMAKSVKDTNYTVLTTDVGTILAYNGTTAATFTMPSVGADEDTYTYDIINESYQTLTVSPSDTDCVWNSGWGYGVEMVGKGCGMTIRYYHSGTKWDIVNRYGGGKVRIEGLKLHSWLNCAGQYQAGANTYTLYEDKAKSRPLLGTATTLSSQPSESKFPPVGHTSFNGTTSFLQLEDSTDWDVFGSSTDDWTIGMWVYPDTAARAETIMSHYEGSGNRWQFFKDTNAAVGFLYYTDSVAAISITGGAIGGASWSYVTICKKASVTGVYLNGAQVACDTAFTTDNFAATLYIGQSGAPGGFLAGKMQDPVIVNQNYFNLNPDTAAADTFTVPANLLELTC